MCKENMFTGNMNVVSADNVYGRCCCCCETGLDILSSNDGKQSETDASYINKIKPYPYSVTSLDNAKAVPDEIAFNHNDDSEKFVKFRRPFTICKNLPTNNPEGIKWPYALYINHLTNEAGNLHLTYMQDMIEEYDCDALILLGLEFVEVSNWPVYFTICEWCIARGMSVIFLKDE